MDVAVVDCEDEAVAVAVLDGVLLSERVLVLVADAVADDVLTLDPEEELVPVDDAVELAVAVWLDTTVTEVLPVGEGTALPVPVELAVAVPVAEAAGDAVAVL